MLSISCEINSPEMFLKAKIKKLYWAFAWCSLKIPCIDLWQCLRGQILNYLNVGSIKIVRCEVTSLIPSEREASHWVTSPFLLVANLNSNSAFKKKRKRMNSSTFIKWLLLLTCISHIYKSMLWSDPLYWFPCVQDVRETSPLNVCLILLFLCE